MQSLKLFASDSLHKYHITQKAFVWWTNATLARCFASWARYSAQNKAERLTMQTAVKHMMSAKAVAALNSWRDWTATRIHHKEVIAIVASRIHNRSAAMAFAAWEEYTAECKWKKQLMDKAVILWQEQRARAAVLKWHAWLVHRKEMRVKVAKALRRLQKKGVEEMFVAWRDYVAWSLLVRRKCNKFVTAMRSKRKEACFFAWHSWWVSVVETRHAERKAAHWFAQAVYGKYFAAWHTEYQESKKLRHALAWFTNAALVRCLEVWKHNVRVRKVMRLIQGADDSCKEKYFARWFEKVKWQIRDRELKRQAVSLFRNRTLVMCMHRWRTVTQTMRAVRQFFGRSQANELKQRFDRWAAWADKRKRTHRAGDALRLLTGSASARVTWDAWRAAYFAVRHARLARLRSIWKRWFGLVTLEKQQRQRVQYARKFLSNGCLYRSFAAWHDLTVASKEFRAHLHRVHVFRQRQESRRARWRLHTLSTTFAAWHADASRSALTRRLSEQFRFLHGPAKVFYQWRENAHDQRLLREKFAAAVGYSEMATLRAGFDGWVDGMQEQKSERLGWLLATDHADHSLKTKYFATWHRNSSTARSLRSLITRISGRSVGVVFRAWLREVRVVRFARDVTYAEEQRILRLRLGLWYAFAKQRKRDRIAEMLAVEHFSGGLAHKYFNRWADEAGRLHELRGNIQQVLKKVFSGVKRRRFEDWREYVAHQHRLRHAASWFFGRTKRHYFVLWHEAVKLSHAERLEGFHELRRLGIVLSRWRDFAAHQVVLKRKVAGYLERLRWKNGAGAFQRWVDWVAERKTDREATEMATRHYEGGLLAHSFDNLVTNANNWRIRIADGTEIAEGYHEAALMTSHLHAWHKYATLRAQMSAFAYDGAEELADHKRRALLRSVLNSWHDVAGRRRKAAMMMARHPEMWRRQAFAAWRHYVLLRRSDRAKEARADAWYTRSLLSNAFVTWRGRAYSELVHQTARDRWEHGDIHPSSIKEVLGLI